MNNQYFSAFDSSVNSCVNFHSCNENCTHEKKIELANFSLGNNTKCEAIIDKRKALYAAQNKAKQYLKGVKNRISHCLSTALKTSEGVYIFGNSDCKTKYKGLMLCGSRWSCPICAEKLIEASRQDILTASTKHLENGGSFIFLTLTTPHVRSDKLDFLVQCQKKALKKFFGYSRVKSAFESLDKLGHIRSYELKHGFNGWHPHFHFLYYINKMLDKFEVSKYSKILLAEWQKACIASGLKKPNSHGLDFKSCTNPIKASEYIVKDSFEIAYSNTKGSKSDSVNPFDLLKIDNYRYGNAKDLYVEYYKSTKGLALICWSRGLKKHFAIGEKTDDEILHNELEQYDIPIVQIPYYDWIDIRVANLRCELLEFTEDYIKFNNLISIDNYSSFISEFKLTYCYDVKKLI